MEHTPRVYSTADASIVSYKRSGGGAGQNSISSNATNSIILKQIEWDSPRLEIGRGGFAAVFRSKAHGWKGLTVAVKEFHSFEASSKMFRTAQTELDVLQKLQHPHVVLCFGGQLHPQPSIVLEYCPDGDLYGLIHNEGVEGLLETSTITLYGWQIVSALTFLHSRTPPLIRTIPPGSYRDDA